MCSGSETGSYLRLIDCVGGQPARHGEFFELMEDRPVFVCMYHQEYQYTENAVFCSYVTKCTSIRSHISPGILVYEKCCVLLKVVCGGGQSARRGEFFDLMEDGPVFRLPYTQEPPYVPTLLPTIGHVHLQIIHNIILPDHSSCDSSE